MAKAKPTAIAYLRVSTDRQAERGLGLEVQERAIRAWARANGVRLVDVLRDEGQSGSNGLDSRVGLAEALARCESGEATQLVVYRYDRLARDLLLQETLIARLQSKDVEVVSTSEPTQGDEVTRTMVRQLLGVIAQYERAVIRGRMANGKAAKRANGGYLGGPTPYGTRPVDGALVEDETEREVVELVTSMRSQSAPASYREVCAALEAAGLPTRRGGPWQPAVVRRIAQRAGVS